MATGDSHPYSDHGSTLSPTQNDARSPDSSNGVEKAEKEKQAACLNCRKSKTRCLRKPDDAKCKKCTQAQLDCVIPSYRVGRKKGIKNKRDGLEKAVYCIEQAIKKSRTQSTQSNNSETSDHDAFNLQNLLSEFQGTLPQNQVTPGHTPMIQHPSSYFPLQNEHHSSGHADEAFAFDDAENPLQLLARASDITDPSSRSSSMMDPSFQHPGYDPKLQSFFGPFRPRLDVGSDNDPINLGLVTEDEAAALFSNFYENLAHTRWGLDALLHTLQFCRKQSLFLFTSIMAASALFLPGAAAISKRLSAHRQHLAQHILVNRLRSPEIVLGFMINIPWMAPGKHWSDDETCSYVSSALTIAIDISLNKLIVPSPSLSLTGIHECGPPSDHISARRALDLDGFHDVDPCSDFGLRLNRRRERIWLALFVLDRGVCMARGRGFTVPLTPIIEHCDNWHQSDVADIWDGALVSSVMLRRDLETLISDIKRTFDGNGNRDVNGHGTAQALQNMIDGFFANWYSTWIFATGGTKDNSIPPYVEILVCHSRLSICGSVINHPTAPPKVKHFFRAAGLSSALNVMRAAVQGENRLKSMPNNTAIMISFAACFAFHLSTSGSNGHMSLAPSIRKLIEEAADVLERIGSAPPHRNGTSALYGNHLREVVGQSMTRPDRANSIMRQQSTGSMFSLPQNTMSMQQQHRISIYGDASISPLQIPQMPEVLPFSAMSDEQINQTVNNAGQELGMLMPGFQMDDKTGLDWLDWFNNDPNAVTGTM